MLRFYFARHVNNEYRTHIGRGKLVRAPYVTLAGKPWSSNEVCQQYQKLWWCELESRSWPLGLHTHFKQIKRTGICRNTFLNVEQHALDRDHCDNITWTSCRIKSPFIQWFVQTHIKEKSKLALPALYGWEFTGNRWVPRKGPVRQKRLRFDDVIMIVSSTMLYSVAIWFFMSFLH